MDSRRIQLAIEILLDRAQDAFARGDWDEAARDARRALLLDDRNEDAAAFVRIAEANAETLASIRVSTAAIPAPVVPAHRIPIRPALDVPASPTTFESPSRPPRPPAPRPLPPQLLTHRPASRRRGLVGTYGYARLVPLIVLSGLTAVLALRAS